MIEQDETTIKFALRLLGAFIGVAASLIMVAPEHTRAAAWRILVGLTMGVIFAPTVPHWGLLGWSPLSALAGDGQDLILARAAASGFAIWFILEIVARVLAGTEYWERLLKLAIDMRTRGRGTGGSGDG